MLISGCTKGDEQTRDLLPVCEQEQILIYHQYEEKIISYDQKKKQIASMNLRPNFYQFSFGEDSRVYTSGNSISNNYAIISVHEDRYDVLKEYGNQEAIFPLASENDIFIFIHSYYDKEGNEYLGQREICQMDYNSSAKKLLVYEKLTGFRITHGICIGDTLYFTTYMEKTDSYNLYSIEYMNLNNSPQLIQQGLESPELYEYKGMLITSNHSYIDINGLIYAKKAINYIYKNSLFQIAPNVNGELTFEATNIINGEVYYTVDKIIDFSYSQDDKIIIYGEGFQDEFEAM